MQSETFEDGERPESPVAVGEKLSRGGTPTSVSGIDIAPKSLEPGTPQGFFTPLNIFQEDI